MQAGSVAIRVDFAEIVNSKFANPNILRHSVPIFTGISGVFYLLREIWCRCVYLNRVGMVSLPSQFEPQKSQSLRVRGLEGIDA